MFWGHSEGGITGTDGDKGTGGGARWYGQGWHFCPGESDLLSRERRGRQVVRIAESDICLNVDRPKGIWSRYETENRVDRHRTEEEVGKGL